MRWTRLAEHTISGVAVAIITLCLGALILMGGIGIGVWLSPGVKSYAWFEYAKGVQATRDAEQSRQREADALQCTQRVDAVRAEAQEVEEVQSERILGLRAVLRAHGIRSVNEPRRVGKRP